MINPIIKPLVKIYKYSIEINKRVKAPYISVRLLKYFTYIPKIKVEINQ